MFIIVVKNRRHTRKGKKRQVPKNKSKQTEVHLGGRGEGSGTQEPPPTRSGPAVKAMFASSKS